MGELLRATVAIEGTRPMLWHHFGPNTIPLEKAEREGVAGNNPAEWKGTVLALTDGQLYIDGTYVFGCLRAAAKYTKKGRSNIQSAVAATLQIVNDVITIDRYLPDRDGHGELTTDPTRPVYLDVRSVVNPGTGARNVRYRIAASSGWHAGFEAEWDKTVVSRSEMQAVMRDGGKLSGLGDGRTIGFGRFKIVSCEIAETPTTA